MNDFLCPICRGPLDAQDGNQLHPGNPDYGVTVYCPSRACPAQEVAGHHTTLDKAFRVIKEKFPIDKRP